MSSSNTSQPYRGARPGVRRFRSSWHRLGASRHGSVATIFGLALVPVMVSVGVAVDYARLSSARTSLQAALDSAVLAGVTASSSSQTTVAQNTLTGALGVDASRLTAQSFTPGASNTLAGTATISVPLTILPVAQLATRSVSATATAIVTTSGSTSNVCILIKDPSATQALLVNSNVTISAKTCEIDVASTASPAAIINNGSGIDVASLCVAGANVITNGAAPASLKKSCTTASDPFAGNLPAVTNTTCTVSNQNYSGTVPLSPGVYCGNFNFNGSGTLNLAPGLYVLKGTRWNLNSGWTVSGTDVTFYFADSNSYIQVNSGVKLSIAAPTTGTYANILIYEPTGLSTSSFTINGSAGHAFTGLIYLPSRNVTFNSISTVSSESITMVFNQLILDTINWTFTSGAKTITPAAGGGTRSARLLY